MMVNTSDDDDDDDDDIIIVIVSWPPHQVIWSAKSSLISSFSVFYSKSFYSHWRSEWDNETDVGWIVDSIFIVS